MTGHLLGAAGGVEAIFLYLQFITKLHRPRLICQSRPTMRFGLRSECGERRLLKLHCPIPSGLEAQTEHLCFEKFST